MLIEAVWDVINEVKENVCDEKNLVKIKETALRERESGLKENQFWLNTISTNDQSGEDIFDLNTYTDWVNNLKAEDLKIFANKYLKTDNYAKFVLVPEK